jgi:hypothetical protein
MAPYGTVRSTAPSDLLRTIKLPGSRLKSASTSRLLDLSKTIALMSPKFSAGADAAAGAEGADAAVDAAFPVAALPPRGVVGAEVPAGDWVDGFAEAVDGGVVADATAGDAAAGVA